MKIKVYGIDLPIKETGLIPHFNRRFVGIFLKKISVLENYFLLEIPYENPIETLRENLVNLFKYFEDRNCKIERIDFL